MSVLLSGNHPFPIDAVAFNAFDHTVSVSSLMTPTGVPYAVLTYTPRSTPGFDYNQFFTYAGAPSAAVNFTVSFDATIIEARNYFLSNGAPDLTGQLTAPRALSAAEIANARAALAEYSQYANLVFTEVSGGADIMYLHDERFGVNGFARNDFDVSWSAGGAYTLENIVGFAAIGSRNDPYMFVHELGHVLTLKHVGPIQTDSETPFLPAQFLDSKYSIMFYDVTHSEVIDPGERFTRHLQLFDVYALQQRFGSNMSWNAGDDIYTAASFDGWRQVLWDAGGEDTIDFRDQSSDQKIDLREGGFSTLGGFGSFNPTDNLSIAYGAVIEHAVGGKGDDKITGNDARNNLRGSIGDDFLHGQAGSDTVGGGAGRDTLLGGFNSDTLIGGAGPDILNGGTGIDKADYTAAPTGVALNLQSGGWAGDAAGDRFISIEIVSGSNHNDTLTGSRYNDDLRGRGGSDLLDGAGADDKLYGYSGNDTLIGGAGNDTLTGGSHNDRFVFSGAFGHDVIQDMNAGAFIRDVIEINGFGPAFDSFAEILAATTDIGGNAVIDINGNTITLAGVAKAQLDANDFIFG